MVESSPRLDTRLAELIREVSIPDDVRQISVELAELAPGVTVGEVIADPGVFGRVGYPLPGAQRLRALAVLRAWATERAEPALPAAPISDWRGFAEAHHVAWALDCVVERAGEFAAGLGFVFDRLPYERIDTVGKLLEAEPQAVSRHMLEPRRRAREAAAAFVRRQAELARDPAVRVEPTRPAAGAAAHKLWPRLERLRAGLRAEVVSRPAEARITGQLRFEEDPPLITRYSHEERATRTVITSLALAGGKPEVSCRCTKRAPAVCDHTLALVEDFMAELAEPLESERGAWADRVARFSVQAPWQRVLDVLDGLAGAETAPAQHLGFLVARRGDALQLSVIVDDGKTPGKGRRLRDDDVDSDALEDLASPSERAVLEILSEPPYYRRNDDPVARALDHLVGHPRVYVKVKTKVLPLVVRRAQVALAMRGKDDGSVELGLSIEGKLLGTADEDALAASGGTLAQWVQLDEAAGRATVATIDRRVGEVWLALRKHGRVLPAEATAALAERLPALTAVLPVDADASMLGREIEAEPRLLLRLVPDGGDGIDAWVGVRVLPGAPVQAIGRGAELITARVNGERVCARRQLDDERTWARTLLEPLASTLARVVDPFVFQVAGEPALELIEGLPALADRVEIEWPAGRERRVHAAGVAKLSFRVTQGRDWFGLDGQVDAFGLAVPLAELLAAWRAGQRFVRVGERDWLHLTEELRARLGLVANVTHATRHGLEVPALAAPALAEQLPELAAPPRWAELVAKARAAARLVPAPPGALGVTLRDYQVAGFEWLARLAAWAPGACLADDMGLGKTIQALALLETRAALGPALVVAPTSVCFNWMREIARVAPGLRARQARETDVLPAELGPGDVYVVSYGVMARDLEALKARHFATLVLDEAQALKNPASQRARAVLELDAGFTLALTGTPLENRLAELWSLYRVIAPGLLGSWEGFRERYALPIERDDDRERRAALARLVRPFLLRRLKQEVAPELPPREEVRVDVALSPEERSLYERERLMALTQLGQVSGPVKAAVAAAAARAPGKGHDARFQVLAALTRLRQLACHPRLVDPASTLSSSKLERMVELVGELRDEGHRALIFSQFTSLLALVREALDQEGIAYLYLDGATPAPERQRLVDAFQAGEGVVFLISLKAGGTGLNLTAADNVIHLDPWWNPAVEDQASDRSHRIGQTRHVTIYKLVALGTVEEKIVAMQEDKRALVAGVLEGTGVARAASTNELLALLADDVPVVANPALRAAKRPR
jgi:superfamily II DNA or RNA helicase